MTHVYRFNVYVTNDENWIGSGIFVCDEFGHLVELNDLQLDANAFFRFN